MGKGSKWIAASGGNRFGYCETHTKNLSSRQKKNRGCHPCTLGEVQGGEEERGLEPAEPITRIVLHSYSSEECRQLCCLWSMPSLKAYAPVHSFEEPTFPASKGWLVRPPR